MTNEQKTQRLKELATLIPEGVAVTVGEFNAEDDTPTLHVYLWRQNRAWESLPSKIHDMELVAEGFWDGGGEALCFQLKEA